MIELENGLENGLEIDGRLVIEGIKAGQKSGAGVFWNLIFSLDQAHENGEYELPDSFLRQYPDHDHSIQTGEDYIRYTLEKARTVYSLWSRIYKAATETKNQIGLDEMMEWGKAFADYYSEFRIALENQKNYLSCHLPALEEIKELKSELERVKTTPEIMSKLDNLAALVSSMSEFQKANRAAEREEHSEIKQEIRQKQKENQKQPGLTQEQAADVIRRMANTLKVSRYKKLTVRTIQNWESENPKHKAPSWYPGRNCELASFAKSVECGLKNEKITRFHRESLKNIKHPILCGSEEELEKARRQASHTRDYTPHDDDDTEEDDMD